MDVVNKEEKPSGAPILTNFFLEVKAFLSPLYKMWFVPILCSLESMTKYTRSPQPSTSWQAENKPLCWFQQCNLITSLPFVSTLTFASSSPPLLLNEPLKSCNILLTQQQSILLPICQLCGQQTIWHTRTKIWPQAVLRIIVFCYLQRQISPR